MAGLAFVVLGAAIAALAVSAAAWGWLWPAVVALAVGSLYATHTAGGEQLRERVPRAFGKRRDGTQSLLVWIPWGPYLAYTWLLHETARFVTREPPSNEVACGLWVGRRPRLHELPADTTLVVDLCAELPAARGVAGSRSYLSLPTLDASSPTPRQLEVAVKAIVVSRGATLVHCAFGHGRSATVAAAVLLSRGEATLRDVESKLRTMRPGVRMTWGQRRALADWVHQFLK